ncbi:hypothetical protein FRC16_008669 [Serendipita sp. 398]|nr:hypothetical protein FRC16_008669 [Serendipita sp. 398]
MGGSTNAGGEEFGSDDEGGRVSTEIEEELHESEAGDERTFAQVVDLTGQDGEEETGHDKAHELEFLAADDIDEEEGDVVAWQESERGDDDLETQTRFVNF